MDAELVRKLFDYSPDTGVLRWKINISRHRAGAVAGIVRGDKRYIEVRYRGSWFAAHRLIFLFVEGRWPEPEVDHENRDGCDNRWDNLREATRAQNAQNRRVAKTNKVGLKGVLVVERYGVKKFEARIRIAGKQKHLGRFDTAQEAHMAYVREAEKHYGPFARGA